MNPQSLGKEKRYLKALGEEFQEYRKKKLEMKSEKLRVWKSGKQKDENANEKE